MEFLRENDFKGVAAKGVLATLKGNSNINLAEAEGMAISKLDPLRGKFDIDAELSKTGDNRNKGLVRMMVNITAYYLYNTVPDDDIPERVADNYKDEIKDIEKIASGKMNSTLTALTGDDGKTKTVFRWGSNPSRSHSLYPKSTDLGQ